jgi:cell wall-associated NlpC family hydrolase
MYVYAQLGVRLAHGATDQQRASEAIDLSELRRGDLVFFGNSKYSDHVGIYMGKGVMIDAPHAGATVSRNSITNAWIAGRLLPVR